MKKGGWEAFIDQGKGEKKRVFVFSELLIVFPLLRERM